MPDLSAQCDSTQEPAETVTAGAGRPVTLLVLLAEAKFGRVVGSLLR